MELGSSSSQDVISTQDLAEIEELLNNFSELISNGCKHIDDVIRLFNDKSVVESLFQSGKFGKKEEMILNSIRKGVSEYIDILSQKNALLDVTGQYLVRQQELNETGN